VGARWRTFASVPTVVSPSARNGATASIDARSIRRSSDGVDRRCLPPRSVQSDRSTGQVISAL
jgi:hypothetical protein